MTAPEFPPTRHHGRNRRLGMMLIGGALSTLTLGCFPSEMSTKLDPSVVRLSYEASLDGVPGYDATTRQSLGEVSFLRAGDAAGRRIIYIHGTPGDASAYAHELNNPIQGFEHIAIDRPGFGKSSFNGKAVTSFEAQARAVLPLLEERPGGWPILVGHSLGGPIVARIAADYPDKVGGIIIVAGSLDPSLEKPRWYNYAGSIVGFVMSKSMRHSNQEIFAAVEETKKLDAVLDRITCPVIVIHGDKDSLVPVANTDYMRQHLVNAESVDIEIIKGEGHFILWTHKQQIRNAVRRMLGVTQ